MHHGTIDAATAAGLKALASRIEASDIPASKLDETLLIATWNIREFGKKRRLIVSASAALGASDSANRPTRKRTSARFNDGRSI